MNTILHSKAVLRERRHELLGKAGVVAVGVGYKIRGGVRTSEPAIVCSVQKKLPLAMLSMQELIPQSIEQAVTDVIEVGVIRALATLPTDRWRPTPGGVSIGHKSITAGTLGCLVRKAGAVYILSNNHVLANSNAAEIGDEILQPGPYDGGNVASDVLARLTDFVRITFVGEPPSDCKFATGVIRALNAGCVAIGSRTRYRITRPLSPQATENKVDAALALPVSLGDVVDTQTGIGVIDGTAEAEVGTKVVKSGRTTGITRGEIIQTDVTTQVQYGPGQIAIFSDQIMAGPISQGGDSGSAVLNEQNRFIGLLFAGSETVTIINRAANVLMALQVTR